MLNIARVLATAKQRHQGQMNMSHMSQ